MSDHEQNAAPRVEPINRDQMILAPVNVERLIPQGHPARNIWEFLGRLDLSRFAEGIKSVEGHAGRNVWDPRLLIAIWLYGYSRGISSAREIERQSEYEPALQWLTGLRVVNHHTLSDFRVRHGQALQELFEQVLGILLMEKLVSLERVTVDGTKVRAHVNKKTYRRQDKIREHLRVARKHLKELQKDEGEQEKRGRQEGARQRAAEERVERLEAALAEVERLQAGKKYDKDKPCQASESDSDAQFMRTSDNGVVPGYNVQLTTDCEQKLIVDVAVSKEPSDAHQLLPALDRMKERVGRYPAEIIADGDYTTRKAVLGAAERGVDFYGSWPDTSGDSTRHGAHPDYQAEAFKYDPASDEVTCPEGKQMVLTSTLRRPEEGLTVRVYAADREDCWSCPKRQLCTPQNKMEKHGRTVSLRQDDERLVQFREKMETEKGKTVYKRRSPVAEFPNLWLKEKLKWVRVRSRGIVKVTAEALWVSLVYNLQRYFTLRALQQVT